MSDAPAETLSTSISRKWFLKLGAFWIVCVGITIWGLADGLVIYPARGERVAQHTLMSYLEFLEGNRRLRPDTANVLDPATELSDLEAAREANPESLSELDMARLQWLQSLDRIHSMGSLTRQNEAEMTDGTLNADTVTMFVRPRDTLTELQAEIGTQNPPKELKVWDIPSQFALAAVFGLAALGLTWRIATTLPVKYRYEPGTMTLHMPGGVAITPADIEVVDKRKWDKFFVTLELKNGMSYTLDLMRFEPLEAWFLEMERHTEGYEPEDDEADEVEVASGGGEDAAEDGDAKAEQTG